MKVPFVNKLWLCVMLVGSLSLLFLFLLGLLKVFI